MALICPPGEKRYGSWLRRTGLLSSGSRDPTLSLTGTDPRTQVWQVDGRVGTCV